MRRLHVFSDLFQYTFLRAGGFERQHGFDSFPDAIVQFEGDACLHSRLGPLQRQPAFQPEEFLKNQSPLRRTAERVQQTHVGTGLGEMEGLDRRPTIRQLEALADSRWQGIEQRLDGSKNAVGQTAKDSCGDLAGCLVNRHDAASVERGLTF